MDKPQIPDKLYFKIGEVSDLVRVKPYVLRFWESEFRNVCPVKSRTNQRLYKKNDIELLLRIKHLLHKERFTISGAKRKLKEEYKDFKKNHSLPQQQPLGFITEIPKRLTKAQKKEQIVQELKTLLQEMVVFLKSE